MKWRWLGLAALRPPNLAQAIQALAVVSMICIGAVAVMVFRTLQDASVSDTAARGFGPRMVQILDSYAYDIPRTMPDVDLNWHLLTGNRFSQPTRRGWSETLLRLQPEGRAEILVRVTLKSTGIDPNIFLSGDLATQLTTLSRRIVALKSDARLKMQLPSGFWVEFDSPTHWRARITHVQIGLLALLVLAVLLWCVAATSARLSRPFNRLALFARALLDQRPSEPMEVRGPAESRVLGSALNAIHRDMERQVQDRTRFLAAISHDLRTPATRMKLRAELIEDKVLRHKMLADLDEIGSMVTAAIGFLRDGLEDTEAEVILFDSLLQSLCDDYVDVGKPVDLVLPEPLVAVVQGTVFDPRPSQFDVPITRQITLQCQPSRLRRAFGNLIDNALKYGDWARVVIVADASDITVRVIDGGPGLSDEERAQVFEPFYRVEASRSRATGGVGLGLSVTKSIIEAHGGQIVVFNHDKHGLEVRVTLPRTT